MSRVTNAMITSHVGPHGQADFEIDFVNRLLRELKGGGGGKFIEVSLSRGIQPCAPAPEEEYSIPQGYLSPAYSAFACFRAGMLGSASFQSVRKF
jgi:hypothetical protein